jgi:diguanylate cyclase (GGDEF)-like protein
MDSAQPIRVLLVEDDEDDYVLTKALLVEGFSGRVAIEWVRSADAGYQQLIDGNFDVALIDHNLGADTGVELLRRATPRGCRMPAIMLTGQTDRTIDLHAMHAGAADYLVKGRVTADMLERAIRYARERFRLLEEIRSLSLIDELTGLRNRRAFFTLAEQRLELLERRDATSVLVFADVDGLKMVNDTLGHDAGDLLLVDAARAIAASFRRSDLVARLGGDEFVVLADDAGTDDIARVLSRLQHEIDQRNTLLRNAPPLSISAGALSFRGSPAGGLLELVAEADALMLQCKRERHEHTGGGNTAMRSSPFSAMAI